MPVVTIFGTPLNEDGTPPEVVEVLEEYLARARAGEFRAVAVVATTRSATAHYRWDGVGWLALLGAVSAMANTIARRIDQD